MTFSSFSLDKFKCNNFVISAPKDNDNFYATHIKDVTICFVDQSAKLLP
jgi:hypothetical protein